MELEQLHIQMQENELESASHTSGSLTQNEGQTYM
jgi:hypothetical protein